MSNNKKLILAIPTNKLMSKTALGKYLSQMTDISEDSAFKAVKRYTTFLRREKKIHHEANGRTTLFKFTKASIRHLKETLYRKDFPHKNDSADINFNKLLHGTAWVTGSTINGCGNLHR